MGCSEAATDACANYDDTEGEGSMVTSMEEGVGEGKCGAMRVGTRVRSK